MSRQNGESMKQYVSRRRLCWTLLVQMDPIIHLSEEHRSDMLLDLSGLTHVERVMVQASINNERNVDSVADALIIQHPRIHLRESQRRAKARAKTGQNVEMIQTFVGFAENAKANAPAAGNLEQVPIITRTSLPLKITIMMTT